MSKIWVHTIVCNEDRFLWFAVMSVIDHVDNVMIWDTGSDDKTVDIIRGIREIKGDKVEFRQVGKVDKYEFTKIRQKMLDQTRADWILIVDGDEVWWEGSIKKVAKLIETKGRELDAIAVPFYSLVGDIYHYQEESQGRYELVGKKGHLTVRAISKKIPGLHLDLPYGSEGYFDKDNKPVQERKGVVFVDAPYLHASHLQRSSAPLANSKFKHELGLAFAPGFKMPEVFDKPYPAFIPSPYQKRSIRFWLTALLLQPLLRLKRLMGYMR